MTEIFFLSQIDRLKRRFGEKHFDIEFIKLVGREVKTMSDEGLQRFVDVMIGSRTHHKPPLLTDFMEARLNEEKLSLSRITNEAKNTVKDTDGLKQILKEQYGNVTNITEAVAFVKLQKRLREADGKAKDHGKDDRKSDTRVAKNEGDIGV